ncbi:hypothetical protein C8R46DRAFT_1329550 [Mycena filopes]|nr:hypothetical protein C8R46DRAFT_1329550 [Mycena filopes]
MRIPRPPIHSLPTELVSAVFDELNTPARPICLPLNPLTPVDSQPQIIRLSQVCRDWRATAHSRRQFWTSYKVDLASRVWTPTDGSTLLALMEEFISYTDLKNAAKLDIVLAIDQGEEESAQDITADIVTTFSRRLSVLHLRLPHTAVEELFDAPTLPFDRLRQFELLIICDVRLDSWLPEESGVMVSDETPTIMANLKELTLTFEVILPHLWACFTAPNLEQLHIISIYDDINRDGGTRWGQTEFMAFRRRSAFTLTTLALCFEFSGDPNAIIEALDTLQEVEVLTLRWTGWRDFPSNEIQHLLQKLNTVTWLPRLRNLTIDATSESVAVLVSRCESQLAAAEGAVLQLRDITLAAEVGPEDLSAVFSQEVDELRAMGCDIKVEVMSFFGGEQYAARAQQEQDESDSDPSETEDEGTDMDDDGDDEDVGMDDGQEA